MDTIQIRGARTHNLKAIDLDLPRDKLIVITGLSGSGKSSLAFDTIYAEGQRRYVESLSAYARQFLSVMEKPDVDHIEGLSPAISIEQKSTSHNPRSTVGTITEIYDYLRLLFARTGIPQCPDHGTSLEAQTITQMVDSVLTLDPEKRWMLLAPVVQERKGEHFNVLSDLRNQGYIRARIDGEVVELDDAPPLELKKKHTIEVVIDRFKVRDDLSVRLAESFETALKLTEGVAIVSCMDDDKDILFSARFACPTCGYSISELEPRSFSFNSPKGACSSCDGLGIKQYIDPNQVLHSPDISLAGGAIRGWDKRNMYYYQMIMSLARHFSFDPEEPFSSYAKDIQQTILYGSGDEHIAFTTLNSRGETTKRTHPFEGIVPSMERRYHETDSSTVRDELSKYFASKACPDCDGQRLNTAARHVFVGDHNLPSITRLSISKTSDVFAALKLTGHRGEIAEKIIKEIKARLAFLINVGLNYLSLDRSADTLSGGEAQRIRLASQIGAGLVGVMYVLDEPSIGLHQRDNQRLIDTLFHLRDIGNTVIVVEHDEDAILAADHVVDIGPNAGIHGGEIIAQGTPQDILDNPNSTTGQYLSGKQFIAVPAKRHPFDPAKTIRINNARANNLKNITVDIPIGIMTCVTGVSGSGKSTLINETLYLSLIHISEPTRPY